MTAQPIRGASAPYDFTKQVGHLLRRAYQRHVSIFQQIIPDSQLTAPQFVALCAIRDLGSCTLKEIVDLTAIDQATIRGVIDRLSQRALIEVNGHPEDGRKLSISLSASGKSLMSKLVPSADQVTERTFGALNAAERVALTYLLEKMCASEQPEDAGPKPGR